MGNIKKLYHICKLCSGTGTEDFETLENGEAVPGSRPCITCDGEGRHSNTHLSDDLIDLLKDMKDKINDIFEKVNE